MRIKGGLSALWLACALFMGCGRELTTTAGSPADVTTGTGNWLVSGFYQTGNNIAPYSFSGSLVNTNGQMSGVFHIDDACFGSGATDVPYTGTVDARNVVYIASAGVNAQQLTFKGLLAADGTAITQGSFKVLGGCTGKHCQRFF